MLLRKLIRLPFTLAFRLTLWYTGAFAILLFGAFLVFYFMIVSVIQGRMDQSLLNEAAEFSSLIRLKGLDGVKTALILEAESEGVNKTFLRILTPTGDILASSNMTAWGELETSRTISESLNNGNKHSFEKVTIPGQRHKIRILSSMIGNDVIFQIGKSLEEDNRFLEIFSDIFGTTIVFIMIFAALIGWFMARRALIGVEEVTRTAHEISTGSLERRVPVKTRGEEIDRLAKTFNSMLDRINTLIKGMREMTDNIAHDLRSPITRIRGIAEMNLTTSGSISDYENMTANIIEECDRLLVMINTMLDISEAEAGAGKLTIEEIDVVSIIKKACELFQPIAEDKGIKTILKTSKNTNIILGDIQKLQRMIANLLDNALKYTQPGGTVTFAVKSDEKRIVISVTDTGIGMTNENLKHIFERFYRCDQSRSQAGIGLGLSLALAIAKAHGGNIRAKSKLGKGSTFTVILPR
jgi:heavy metal sensor kinase